MAYANDITLAVVNFHAEWGDVPRNLARIGEWTEAAVAQGAELVLFPETALTGYNTPGDKSDMQRESAVSLDGPEVAELLDLARTKGIYLVVGLPERDGAAIYNSALVAGPDGLVGCYRKLHPAGKESLWAAKGEEPLLFDTRWGPVAVSICYDTYHFPELIRAYSASGARLCLNPTAVPEISGWQEYYFTQLKARVIENGCIIASANLVGQDREIAFPGGSLIIAPRETNAITTQYLAEPLEGEEGMRVARLDLSIVDKARSWLSVFTDNPITGVPDWRPDICAKLIDRVRRADAWSERLPAAAE